MSISKLFFSAAILVLPAAQSAQAADLKPETLQAWEAHVQEARSRLQSRLDGGRPFLWAFESPERIGRIRRGEVAIAPVVGHGTKPAPSGLIHDWIGAVFIPNATIEALWSVVHDYDRYKDVYTPAVVKSATLAATDADQDFSMTWERHILFVTAAMQGRYHGRDVLVDAHRGYSEVDSTQVREIEDYGQPGEHLLPPDTGNGFIWRMHSIARYEERDGGIYLELEAIALTRDIPASLRFLVNPVVNHLSINSLTTTLRQTRDAVTAGVGRAALKSELRTDAAHNRAAAFLPKH